MNTSLRIGNASPAIARSTHLAHLAAILALLLGFSVAMQQTSAQVDTADEDNATTLDDPAADIASEPVALVRGYHGYNVLIFEQALMAQGIACQQIDGWLPTSQYARYGAVVIDGGFKAAKIQPDQFADHDKQPVLDYLQAGGVLMVINQGAGVFKSEAGKALLEALTGSAVSLVKPKQSTPSIATHPWLNHLPPRAYPSWATGSAIDFSKGTGLLAPWPNKAILYERHIGKGRFIFIGWDIFRAKPEGRKARPDPDKELAYQQQTQIFYHIAQDLFPAPEVNRQPRTFFDHPYTLSKQDASEVSKPTGMYSAKAVGSGNDSQQLIRPLPVPSKRPMTDGPARFVDITSGDDNNDGSVHQPFRTLAHALSQLQPGDTLYLRGGVYYEKVTARLKGTAAAPITIRSYPNELAILDGGIAIFAQNPAAAWRPVSNGAADEYESTQTYPGLGSNPNAVNVMGIFADTYIPLMGYRNHNDLKSDNPYWNLKSNQDDSETIYCGPGIWYNPQTQRIHARFTHTQLPGKNAENYNGPTDPRTLALVIGHRNDGGTFNLHASSHIKLQDLVIRGSAAPTLQVVSSSDITFDGLSVHGGYSAVLIRYTQGLRMINSVVRGQSAPWTYRSSLKYRGVEARLFVASGSQPQGNTDFDIAYNEFTDSIDGVSLGNVKFVRFHHNLLDNCTDDGLFLTATADHMGQMHGGPILIYQNLFARCLQVFAFGAGHGRQPASDNGVLTGSGLWVYRNIFDLRGPVNYFQPRSKDDVSLQGFSRSQVDHGSPVWEPMIYYQNTLVTQIPAFRSGYLNGWGAFANTPARVLLNNIVVQLDKPVGANFMPGAQHLLFDANLHWSASLGHDDSEAFADRIKKSLAYLRRSFKDDTTPAAPIHYFTEPASDAIADLLPDAKQRQTPLALCGQRDQYADPLLAHIPASWREPINFQLSKDSPAIDAGVAIPRRWPDPLRSSNNSLNAKPDLGALPHDSQGWRYGVHGRLTITP